MTGVKICGITNPGDAMAAVEAGADALGFVFYALSKRVVTAQAAAEIIRALPREVRKVGVFVDAAPGELRRTIEVAGIDTLQLHGSEPPEVCRQFDELTVWKAFRIRSAESLKGLSDYADVDAWVLDSYVPKEAGGTGAAFDWRLASEARTRGRPIILAGGLTPENVAEAVGQVHPYMVDVSTGVELAPGKKDLERMRAFIAAARGVV